MEFGARNLGWQGHVVAVHSVCDGVKVANLSDDGWTILTPVVADAAQGGIAPRDCRLSDFKFRVIFLRGEG